MKKIVFIITTIIIYSYSIKSNKKNNTVLLEYGKKNTQTVQAVQIFSLDDFLKFDQQKNLGDEEIITFFDSLIPDNLNLLSEICYSEENSNCSDNLKKICAIYKIYLLLCKRDFDSAKKQIEKLQSDEVVNYQLDKFTGFYFWCVKKYEAANWNADFYYFRYYREKERTIKRSNSRIKFEIKFWHDSAFKYLKKAIWTNRHNRNEK